MSGNQKRTPCDEYGHSYIPAAAPGWFRCERIVHFSKKGVATTCASLALCPACLGYRIAGYVSLFCELHAQSVLHDFPMVLPEVTSSDEESLSGDQLSLW